MKESLIFAALIESLNNEEKKKLDELILTKNLIDLKILIVEYIKKYQSTISHLI